MVENEILKETGKFHMKSCRSRDAQAKWFTTTELFPVSHSASRSRFFLHTHMPVSEHYYAGPLGRLCFWLWILVFKLGARKRAKLATNAVAFQNKDDRNNTLNNIRFLRCFRVQKITYFVVKNYGFTGRACKVAPVFVVVFGTRFGGHVLAQVSQCTGPTP